MSHPGKITFVTGTDTGVGKTLLTALLLQHMRQCGQHALAMKPFCSGGRGDVDFLQSLQEGELSDDEMNPFYFARPEAPMVSLRRQRKNIRLADVIAKVQSVQKRCDHLLIEGAGGLLVPLGHGYTVADLIVQMASPTVIVARNRLGTINHTLLTINELTRNGVGQMSVVLMDDQRPDCSAGTNRTTLRNILHIPVVKIPFLGTILQQKRAFLESRKKVKKELAQILK